MFTHPNELYYALINGFFEKVPLNSVNFGNLLGELYYLIQKHQIGSHELFWIQSKYLNLLDSENLNDQYQVLVNSLNKIRIKVGNEDAN